MTARIRRKRRSKYRVLNWSEYNQGLKRRGDVRIWLSDDVIAGWHAQQSGSSGRGRPYVYSDVMIECALSLRCIFHLGLRQTQGFIESLLGMLNIPFRCACYSTFSRRSAALLASVKQRVSDKDPSEPIDICIDSSGLKIYGEGEWKRKKHGKGTRREWRKLHIGCTDDGRIVTQLLTDNKCSDDRALPELLDAVNPDQVINTVRLDGAYDRPSCYQAIARRGAKANIPPPCNATIDHDMEKNSPRMARNSAIERINALGGGAKGKHRWRQESGHYQREKAENSFSRFKAIFSPALAARTLDNQKVEAAIKCTILNQFLAISRPISQKITP